MIPLCFADPNEEVVIRKVGGSPEVKQHLYDLGFVVGGKATVITSLNGNRQACRHGSAHAGVFHRHE